jgi:hypothetical protein
MSPPKVPTNGDAQKAAQELTDEEAEEILQMPEVQEILNGHRKKMKV